MATKRIEAIKVLKDSIEKLGIEKDNKGIEMEDIEGLINLATDSIDKSITSEQKPSEIDEEKEEVEDLEDCEMEKGDKTEYGGRRGHYERRKRWWKHREEIGKDYSNNFNNRRKRFREEYYKDQGKYYAENKWFKKTRGEIRSRGKY